MGVGLHILAFVLIWVVGFAICIYACIRAGRRG